MEWTNDFFKLYFDGKRAEAYKCKQKNMPNKLYKFQPFDDLRINTLLRNEIWFSTPSSLNDPFDCYGVYWDEVELTKFFKEKLPNDTIKKHSVNEIVDGALNSIRDRTQISCFSEQLFNMPMWAHYANNHQGMCVEYDFSKLSEEVDFSKQLYPVAYEENRYNISNLIKLSFEETPDMRIYLLYFLMQIKHKSWSYEKEWRIMLNAETKTSGLHKCPVSPSAIYFGLNCKEYKSIANSLKIMFDCPMYKLIQPNIRSYEFEVLEI
ncbi:DUF2971 domain-containing protein [Paenibacillus oryzisoli]|uniref:DUF2971 domain-containing protein n=1 Tax=Paenibacillus oryzisoli TaxID=1850517 RepID=UPI003D299053